MGLNGSGRELALTFSALPDVEHLELGWDEVEEVFTALGCGTFCTIGRNYPQSRESLEMLERLLSDALSFHLRLWQGSAALAHLRQAAWELCCLRGSCRLWCCQLGIVGTGSSYVGALLSSAAGPVGHVYKYGQSKVEKVVWVCDELDSDDA